MPQRDARCAYRPAIHGNQRNPAQSQPFASPNLLSGLLNFLRWIRLASLLLLPLGVGAAGAPGQGSLQKPRIGSEQPRPRVLELGLQAVACAQASGLPPAQRLALIDYSLSANQPRLWVYDLASGELLFRERVAHGRGTGQVMAVRFSNKPDSLTSSLGLFRTGEAYDGSNGYSLRLEGLEAGFNDRAYERAIVMHGADYVRESFIDLAGRLGRSHGCPAVRPEIARPLIDSLRQGQYLFAYYPDPAWLKTSRFLACQPAGALVKAATTATHSSAQAD